MHIGRLGEFGLIERMRKSIKVDSSVIVGSGDDCAVLKFDKKYFQLFTCDMLVESVDFTKQTDLALVGRKALAVSLSDIAACAGLPRYAVVSLGLPKGFSVRQADKLIKGMVNLANVHKLNIVGGDISVSSKLVIDVSMLGIVEKDFLVKRSGAEKGDIIFTTGSLGGSIKGKHLKFIPRLKEARFLVENFKVNSMIDISDGLAQDLGHILVASRKGAVIYEALVPKSKEAETLEDALYSGEDFELLFTMSRTQAKKLLLKQSRAFYPLGEITGKIGSLKLIRKNGKEKNIEKKGFRHF
ncbi:MAG: thiamine-phosphate kinase [Candidatus Omnitrophica bacterium]|jgi:thiamine-monophosphate kinase|nr:thiamine-phosphate kinase [Candidatus Omnitrophota bacterium]